MSNRYLGGFLIASYDGLKVPDAPTIGTATNGDTTVSVTFTAPANAGGGAITDFTVTSSPSGITGTGASSPITVSGLSNGTAYTFTVIATNAFGNSLASAASNSVTPAPPQQVAYTTAGTYTFIVPAGISPATISVLAVGPGSNTGTSDGGGAGGGLGYKTAFSVSPLASYTVVVGASNSGTDSYFSSAGFCKGGAGSISGNPRAGGSYTGDGGGNGGAGGTGNGFSPAPYPTGGGGGAGGYSGAGGAGGAANNSSSQNGTAGSGGGGGGGASGGDDRPGSGFSCGGGGGGVGLLGAGSNGAAGTSGSYATGTCDIPSIAGIAGSGGVNGNYQFGSSALVGNYGGGGSKFVGSAGGAVRVIYSTTGVSRSYPSTNTGNL